MNDKSRKPTFQQAPRKAFQERTVGEKSRQNQPHFAEKPFSERRSERKNDRHDQRNERREEVRETRISELNLNRANGETGAVKVMVKSTGVAYKAKEKKTGALSPRAPEKIKKNRSEEMKVYGENACLALFAERPESIVRVWTTVQMAHRVGDLFSYLAANKKVYHVVEQDELALVSGTEHHGGICMLVKKQRTFTLSGYVDIPRQKDALVLIDGVNNAQNFGGVIRTCAFFGIKNVVLENTDSFYAPAAMRVAEGGAEHIRVLTTESAVDSLQILRKAGYQIIHISQDNHAETLDKLTFSDKVVFVLSESSTEHLATNKDSQVRLSFGSPIKHGLNVAVNAGVMLSKWYFSA